MGRTLYPGRGCSPPGCSGQGRAFRPGRCCREAMGVWSQCVALSAVLAAVCLPLIAGAPAGPTSRHRLRPVSSSCRPFPGRLSRRPSPVARSPVGTGVGEAPRPFSSRPAATNLVPWQGRQGRLDPRRRGRATPGRRAAPARLRRRRAGGDRLRPPAGHRPRQGPGAGGPHRAVAPADVEVDGPIVFTNIANGEFATADVPDGKFSVPCCRRAWPRLPILGPLDVALKARTCR